MIGGDVRATLAAIEAVEQTVPASRADVLRRVDAKLADWRGLLDRHVSQSRQILRKLLDGPIICTPLDGQKGLRFRGDVSLGPVISAVIGAPTKLASPPGFVSMWNTALAGQMLRHTLADQSRC